MPQHVRVSRRVGVELTPKALANSSPGFERSENPGNKFNYALDPERVRWFANPFRVDSKSYHSIPG